MKKVFKFPLFIMMFLMLAALQAGFASPPSTAGTATGTANITVEYPAISVGGGLGSGVLHLGDFMPPPLSECQEYWDDKPGVKWKRHLIDWNNLFLPFEVNGAIGITFAYSSTRSLDPVSGGEGVRISLPTMKGSSNGFSFVQIPNSTNGYLPQAVFNASGSYFFQLHFDFVDIRYACTSGMRYFDVTLTCNYL
jgi:hypothetical protein